MVINVFICCVCDFGDVVVYFDFKGDVWVLYVFWVYCLDFILLDLWLGKLVQLNLFCDFDQYVLKNLLIVGFNLGEIGDVVDYYCISEQKVVKLIVEQFLQGVNIQQVLVVVYVLLEVLKKDVKGLIIRLENVVDLSVLQMDSGIDVVGIINGGGCLYVIGLMDDEVVICV